MQDDKAADKLMKQAEKCLRPSVLSMRFKPDWDEAYPLFEKAALQYQVQKCTQHSTVVTLAQGAAVDAWH